MKDTMKLLLIVLAMASLLFSSCATMNDFTDEEVTVLSQMN